MLKNLTRRKVIAIHNTIDTASENALAEAIKIIERTRATKHDGDIANRLSNIGFTNSVGVKRAVSKTNVLDMLIKEAEIIQDYQRNYPTLKFLTEDQLNTICKKYKLIYAPVGNYIGEVPEKNLIDIESAPKTFEGHIRKTKITAYVSKFGDKATSEFKKFWKNGINVSNVTNWENISSHVYNAYFMEFMRNCGWMEGFAYDRRYYIESFTLRKIDYNNSLYIAAPKSEFNIKKTMIESIVSKINVTPDPIVFKFVKDGILVLTKWGLEGKDSALVNEIQN